MNNDDGEGDYVHNDNDDKDDDILMAIRIYLLISCPSWFWALILLVTYASTINN